MTAVGRIGASSWKRAFFWKIVQRLETAMTSDESLQFLEHLRRNDHLVATAAGGQPIEQGGLREQSKLWELTKLSAGDFADEAARFAGLARVTLQELL